MGGGGRREAWGGAPPGGTSQPGRLSSCLLSIPDILGGAIGKWGGRGSAFPWDSTSPEDLGTWVTSLPCSQAGHSPQDWLPRGREDLWSGRAFALIPNVFK